MTPAKAKRFSSRSLALACLICFALIGVAQNPQPVANGRGVVRLRVRIATGDGAKARGLSRKRFFLIKGALADNTALLAGINDRAIVSRECFYRGIGASERLIDWLKQSDCESVYCREVDDKDVAGPNAVPEFAKALEAGEKELHNRDLARKWVTVNLPEQIRNGFYKLQQKDLLTFIKQAEDLTRTHVQSVMTDRNGTAYFTDVEPGIYVVSNIIPIELGNMGELWSCEVKVQPGDIATEKPYLISNPGNKDPRDKKNIKCVSMEKPLPMCPAPAR